VASAVVSLGQATTVTASAGAHGLLCLGVVEGVTGLGRGGDQPGGALVEDLAGGAGVEDLAAHRGVHHVASVLQFVLH
jgi:hypothetical protein